MVMYVLVWLFAVLTVGDCLFATSPSIRAHSCATCQGITDPRLCNDFEYCSGECSTERKNGLYYMSCKFGLFCLVNNLAGSLLGKRDTAIYLEDGSTDCSQCCSTAVSGTGCNRQLCISDLAALTPVPTTRPPIPTTTSRASSTTAPIAAHIPTTSQHACATCQGISDPRLCNNFEYCYGECYTERKNDGLYYMSCELGLACLVDNLAGALLGKRRTAVDPDDGNTHCSQCCSTVTSGTGCNRHLCIADLPALTTTTPYPTTTTTTTTTATTTPNPTTTTTTRPTATAGTTPPYTSATAASAHITITVQESTAAVVAPQCRDREEDGIRCATLGIFNLCSNTSSTFAYVLAHQKCPKYCGFCKSAIETTPSLVTQPPEGECIHYGRDDLQCPSVNVFILNCLEGGCIDYEQDGMKCSSLDLFNLCTETSTLEYIVAHKKCSKHCGFCTPASG